MPLKQEVGDLVQSISQSLMLRFDSAGNSPSCEMVAFVIDGEIVTFDVSICQLSDLR
jgi:hypothetical protein